jgi:long-chain acyl-CoA synthetase
LVKLQGGEYIALERLETTYRSCNLVQTICVYGHPNARQPMAIIVPHEMQLRQYLRNEDIGVDPDASFERICESRAIAELVLTTCNNIGKKSGFKSLELLEAVVLTPNEWTPATGFVTASQKLQRKKISEFFEPQIKVCLFPFHYCVAFDLLWIVESIPVLIAVFLFSCSSITPFVL